jgi:hypothetical protein
MHTKFVKNCKRREHLRDLGLDGLVILKWILDRMW